MNYSFDFSSHFLVIYFISYLTLFIDISIFIIEILLEIFVALCYRAVIFKVNIYDPDKTGLDNSPSNSLLRSR
jgi:hypothetical protein